MDNYTHIALILKPIKSYEYAIGNLRYADILYTAILLGQRFNIALRLETNNEASVKTIPDDYSKINIISTVKMLENFAEFLGCKCPYYKMHDSFCLANQILETEHECNDIFADPLYVYIRVPSSYVISQKIIKLNSNIPVTVIDASGLELNIGLSKLSILGSFEQILFKDGSKITFFKKFLDSYFSNANLIKPSLPTQSVTSMFLFGLIERPLTYLDNKTLTFISKDRNGI